MPIAIYINMEIADVDNIINQSLASRLNCNQVGDNKMRNQKRSECWGGILEACLLRTNEEKIGGRLYFTLSMCTSIK